MDAAAQPSPSVRALQNDRVVVGRVDTAIRDAHVATRVDIKPVAVGVDLDVVDREVVNAGGQQRKVTAIQY